MDPMEMIRRLTEIMGQRQSLASALGQGNAQDIAQRAMRQAQEATDRFKADLEGIKAEQEERARAAAELARRGKPTPAPPPDSEPVPPPPEPEPFPEGLLRYVPADRAAEVCQQCQPAPSVQELLRPNDFPRQFLDRLIERGMHQDAIQFLVFGLPRQLAVLYGGLCIRQVTPIERLPAAQVAALTAAMRFLMKPEEALRLAAETAAQAAGTNTAAGSLAMAVRAGAASLAGPELPVVPPPPTMSARLVWSAIRQAAAQAEPRQRDGLLRQLLIIGIWIAVHGPLAPRHKHIPPRTDVRQQVRDLYRELNLIPSGGINRADTSQEVWDYLHHEEDPAAG